MKATPAVATLSVNLGARTDDIIRHRPTHAWPRHSILHLPSQAKTSGVPATTALVPQSLNCRRTPQLLHLGLRCTCERKPSSWTYKRLATQSYTSTREKRQLRMCLRCATRLHASCTADPYVLLCCHRSLYLQQPYRIGIDCHYACLGWRYGRCINRCAESFVLWVAFMLLGEGVRLGCDVAFGLLEGGCAEVRI